MSTEATGSQRFHEVACGRNGAPNKNRYCEVLKVRSDKIAEMLAF